MIVVQFHMHLIELEQSSVIMNGMSSVTKVNLNNIVKIDESWICQNLLCLSLL